MKITTPAVTPCFIGVLSLLACVVGAAPANAEDASDVQTEAEPGEKRTFANGISLGARGFGGILIEDEGARPVFGGGVLVGVPIYRHIEGEASVLLASKGEGPAFFVFELIGKWVPEVEGSFSPHLTLGPLLSVDATDPVSVSGGGIAGAGATFWINDDFGIMSDLNYRLLVGSELSHAATLGLGVVLRPF